MQKRYNEKLGVLCVDVQHLDIKKLLPEGNSYK